MRKHFPFCFIYDEGNIEFIFQIYAHTHVYTTNSNLLHAMKSLDLFFSRTVQINKQRMKFREYQNAQRKKLVDMKRRRKRRRRKTKQKSKFSVIL